MYVEIHTPWDNPLTLCIDALCIRFTVEGARLLDGSDLSILDQEIELTIAIGCRIDDYTTMNNDRL
jgi:hypothetical protein